MAVSPHGESSFFPGGGAYCVDGAVKLLFLCFVSGLGLDGWAVSGFGHGDGASFFSSCAGDRVRFVLLPSFSGVGYVVGGGFRCSSVGEWCTMTVSPAGGLASAIFLSLASLASMLESSVCLLGSSVALVSMAMLNPCPSTWLLSGEGSMLLPMECSSDLCPSKEFSFGG